MNELRMYVEHLFEGKVLTPEAIELKEEIFGNLMARYEDYVASGLSEAEALARTKASITDIDDMMGGEDASDPAPDAAPTTVIPAASETVRMPVAAPAQATGAPTPPGRANGGEAGPGEARTKPKWPMVAGIAALVIIALAAVAFGVNELILDPMQDRQEDIAEAQAEQQWRDQQSQSTGGGASSTDGGANQSTTDGAGSTSAGGDASTPQFADPEDQLEYEATMAVMDEVDSSTAESLRAHIGINLNDTAALLAALQSMPLGGYAANVSTDGTGSSLSVEYLDIDHNVEGDAVDNAIAYDVVALMSLYPSLQTVQVTVNDDDDRDDDRDLYVFERTSVEDLLARATSNAITQANDSLFESEDSWNQVRGYVATERFSDALMEYAERG